ncbi:uncharacterized protein LOC144917652 isoform X3 [Branchiostoma floridae x Branchiostoma belcheri]
MWRRILDPGKERHQRERKPRKARGLQNQMYRRQEHMQETSHLKNITLDLGPAVRRSCTEHTADWTSCKEGSRAWSRRN